MEAVVEAVEALEAAVREKAVKVMEEAAREEAARVTEVTKAAEAAEAAVEAKSVSCIGTNSRKSTHFPVPYAGTAWMRRAPPHATRPTRAARTFIPGHGRTPHSFCVISSRFPRSHTRRPRATRHSHIRTPHEAPPVRFPRSHTPRRAPPPHPCLQGGWKSTTAAGKGRGDTMQP